MKKWLGKLYGTAQNGAGMAWVGVGGSNLCLLAAPMLDESVIIQLVEMGVPMDACRKAVYYTGNSGVEAAMNWVMSHMDDPGMRSHGHGETYCIWVTVSLPVPQQQ